MTISNWGGGGGGCIAILLTHSHYARFSHSDINIILSSLMYARPVFLHGDCFCIVILVALVSKWLKCKHA